MIKVIIKGRSPTMRRVKNHRVALDLLFDSINSDPQFQIKYVDTKNQLSDMLTKGTFTRDEWDHLLRLLNIMNLSMFSCSHFLPIRKQSAVSKRAQESTPKEGSAVAKPRPMSLVSGNLLSAKKDPPQDLSDPNSSGNQELDQTGRRADNGQRANTANGPTTANGERPSSPPEFQEYKQCQEYEYIYIYIYIYNTNNINNINNTKYT